MNDYDNAPELSSYETIWIQTRRHDSRRGTWLRWGSRSTVASAQTLARQLGAERPYADFRVVKETRIVEVLPD